MSETQRTSAAGGDGQDRAERATATCDCDPEKLHAAHRYVEEEFPGCSVRDFHAPVRLMQAGLPHPYTEHHVVSIERLNAVPMCIVLLREFLARPLEEIAAALRRWEVADVLRADRIAVVSAHEASAL